MLVLKTLDQHLQQVEQTSSHGLNRMPRQQNYGIALVQGECTDGGSDVIGVLWINQIYQDSLNQTTLNFNQKFKFFVDGNKYVKLPYPIDLYKVTGNKKYIKNRGILYVDPKDENVVLQAILTSMLH